MKITATRHNTQEPQNNSTLSKLYATATKHLFKTCAVLAALTAAVISATYVFFNRSNTVTPPTVKTPDLKKFGPITCSNYYQNNYLKFNNNNTFWSNLDQPLNCPDFINSLLAANEQTLTPNKTTSSTNSQLRDTINNVANQHNILMEPGFLDLDFLKSSMYHQAVLLNDPKMVVGIKSSVGQINKKSPHFERTALHAASLLGMTEVVEAILSAGANVSPKDSTNATPLHDALIDDSKVDLVKALCRYGADPLIKNNQEETPMDLAIKTNNKEILDVMQKRYDEHIQELKDLELKLITPIPFKEDTQELNDLELDLITPVPVEE